MDFAQARMYAKNYGRFTSVDPLLTTGRVESPQTWNRFTYVLSNPLVLIDPLGLYECKASTKDCTKINQKLAEATEALNKLDPKSKQYQKIKRSIDAYGCDASVCGKKGLNGVTIYATNFQNRTANAITFVDGVAGKKTAENPNGQNISVVFNQSTLDYGGYNLTDTLVHEGTHVAGGTDWVKSGFSNSKNPSSSDAEFDAYTVASYINETLAPNGASLSFQYKSNDSVPGVVSLGMNVYQTWNSSWKDVDKERIRNINGIIKNELSPKDAKSSAFRVGQKFDPNYLSKL